MFKNYHIREPSGCVCQMYLKCKIVLSLGLDPSPRYLGFDVYTSKSERCKILNTSLNVFNTYLLICCVYVYIHVCHNIYVNV